MNEITRYGALVRRWLWLLMAGAIVAGGVGLGVNLLTPPTFRATATLLVNQAQSTTGTASYNDILTSERLTRTYGELIRKRPIVEQVISDLQLPASYEGLVRAIDVRPVRDTQLITLAVEHHDPQLAADIANALANTFVARTVEEQLGQTTSTKSVLERQIADVERQIRAAGDQIEQLRRAGDLSGRLGLLQNELNQAQVTYAQLLRSQQEMALNEARAAGVVRVAEPAVRNDRPVRPNVPFNTLAAAVAGLLLAVGIAVLAEYLDDAVKTPELVEDVSGLHTLGAVVLAAGESRSKKIDPRESEQRRLLVADGSTSPVGEAFRLLRTNVEFAQVDGRCRSLVVTSPNPGEGKSTVAVNLAAVIAQAGRRVLLVDADLRRPTLHRTFGVPNDAGLTTLVAREDADLGLAVRQSAIPGLSLLPSGPMPPNPSEMLGSSRFGRLLDEAEERFDLVVLDTPPGLAVADPIILAPRADGVVVVVDSAKTSKDALRRLADALRHASANVLGVVLNKLTPRSGSYYYYYRSYYDEPSQGGKVNGAARGRGREAQPTTPRA